MPDQLETMRELGIESQAVVVSNKEAAKVSEDEEMAASDHAKGSARPEHYAPVVHTSSDN